MCGRYTVVADANKLKDRFNADVTDNYVKRYNAAPSQLLPVITSVNPAGFSFFYWGLVPDWSKNKSISGKLINARADTIAEKVSFRTALHSRRCLVPADGFYEWKKMTKKSKIPYRFILNEQKPFAFAGLWEEYENEEQEMVHTFTIITTEANEVVKPVHDRMPVILTPETEKLWMNNDTSEQELLEILTPYPAGEMGHYAVTSKVNNPANDDPDLIEPAPAADQFGNYSLFD